MNDTQNPDLEDKSAFPRVVTDNFAEVATGMTLRIYIASAAMQSLLANPNTEPAAAESIAQAAYIIADAMLAASGAK